MFKTLNEQRRSIRKYEDLPVEREKLIQILDAGRMAPSARNDQKWKFVMVTDPAKLAHTVEVCNGQKWTASAPAVLVVCGEESRVMTCGQDALTVDASIATTVMMYQAQDLGLGSCWIASFLPDKAKELYGVPDELTPVAVLTLGYPAETPAPRPRKELDEVAVMME